MTTISRVNSINGGDFTQEIVNNLHVQTIAAAPIEIKHFFQEKHDYKLDPYNSVVLFDSNTNCVYGYILAHTLDIPNIDIIYEGQTKIIEFLKNGFGLYITDVVLRHEIKETPLVNLLNGIHFSWCKGNLSKSLYIWMDFGEILWSPTNQDEGFIVTAPNKVCKAFYDKFL